MAAITAVLLAAGRSELMGEQKAVLPWGGGTLLGYQLAQLVAVDAITDIIVVTGYRADDLAPIIDASPRARAVHNAAYDDGKATSVRCGAAAVGDGVNAVLLLAVDQPRPASLLRALVEAHERGGAAITAPILNGRRGHPLIFGRALLSELLRVDEATLGVRAVLVRHAAGMLEVPVDDPSACIDINTPADAERARALFARASG
jgi:molybdenum cofactor cytidylyltransferase